MHLRAATQVLDFTDSQSDAEAGVLSVQLGCSWEFSLNNVLTK
jgi:hypothetical protein